LYWHYPQLVYVGDLTSEIIPFDGYFAIYDYPDERIPEDALPWAWDYLSGQGALPNIEWNAHDVTDPFSYIINKPFYDYPERQKALAYGELGE
jgi:hypothetical protein